MPLFRTIPFLVLFSLSALCLSGQEAVNFVQLTDPHVFVDDARQNEARNSLAYLGLAIEQVNLLVEDESHIDFVLMTGDLGIEKLLKMKKSFIKGKDALEIDKEKWNKGLNQLAEVLQDSRVKLWLFVPGNNDLYQEDHTTIKFYEKFVKELQEHPLIQKNKIKIVDFRLESKESIGKNKPGVYVLGSHAFVGFDNSDFKMNYSFETFADMDTADHPIHKRLSKLDETVYALDDKYVYIAYHVPEIDDPWLVNFDMVMANNITHMANNNEHLTHRYSSIHKVSEQVRDFIPYYYSAWTLPLSLREKWEHTATQDNVKGLFVGHFHTNIKSHYTSFDWMKGTHYDNDILKKLYICPSISIKNQACHPLGLRARGLQEVSIDKKGNVTRNIIWLEPAHSR